MLNRDYYISKLEQSYENNLIKILVGPRGTGKTTIFSQLMQNLKIKGLADDFHIIYINFEFFENEKYRNKDVLNAYLRKKIIDDKKYFIFLDEIHYVDQFEQTIIDLNYAFLNVNILISSSNSRLLPEDLNSCIHGMYKFFYVTPLSYSESCQLLNSEPKNKNMLFNYLKYGSFPNRFDCRKVSEVKKLLYSLLDSICLRDIVIQLGLNDIEDIFHVLKYIVKHLGNDISLLQLQKEVVEEDKLMPDYRFQNALDSLNRSLIIRGVKGYDVNYDKELRTTHRYYLGDLGISFLYNFDFQNNLNLVLKNWVWLELKRRNYTIYTGVNDGKTFDFVAIKNRKIMYIQVVDELKDGNTVNLEVEKLNGFNAPNPRYLLSLDTSNYSRKGVIHKNIITFILEDLDKLDADDSIPNWVGVE